MTPGTLATILNTAQLIVQNADKLTALIRRRGPEAEEEDQIPATLEGVRSELQRLHQRLDEHDNANVEQLKFIEQLAHQNELLAESIQKNNRRSQWALGIATIAALVSIVLAFAVLFQCRKSIPMKTA